MIRSRGGCPRCRSLKIKCDETKPSCRQCLKRKVTCPGYKRDLRWSDKHEVFTTQRWENQSARNTQSVTTVIRPEPTPSSLPEEASQSGPTASAAQLPVLGSLVLDTDTTSPSLTQDQDSDNPESVASLVVGSKFYDRYDSLSTNMLRDDLREWLVTHEPLTLFDQQDWAWALSGATLDCDNTLTSMGTLDCRDAVASQGNDLNQALVQYFFDNLCCIHSVLDNTAEDFKALVQRYLSSSPLLHKSIVCMSAAHCFQDEESMLPICLECHSAAVRSLSEAVFQLESVIEQPNSPGTSALSENNTLRKLEETLLASLILGFCAPWSDPRDLALPHLRGARKLCEYLINYTSSDGKEPERALANPDHHFLIGAMAYWEACMAFVVDQPKNVVQYLHPFSRPTGKTHIHMFIGISLPLFVTLARVGVCVRQNKALRNMAAVGWKETDAYQSFAFELLQDAIELEKFAIDYTLPADETFDIQTLSPSTNLQVKAFAQMCRFAILLELRRNFPSLVDPKLNDVDTPTSTTLSQVRAIKLDRWCFRLSGAVLSHAKDIPEGSTCGLYQTILLIIGGSALRSPANLKPALSEDLSLEDKLEVQLMSTLARRDEINERRAFVRQRLQTNCASWGLRQVYCRAELLLENVWREFDASSGDTEDVPANRHWIDVMAEQKLETFFG